MVGYKKDNKGETVITQRKPDILSEIAAIGNGNYIDGNRTEEPVNEIGDIVANAEKKTDPAKEVAVIKVMRFLQKIGVGKPKGKKGC